jgi:predicted permease
MHFKRFRHRKRKDEDLAEEIAAHLAHEQEANIARGLPPEEALRQAHVKFGNPRTTRERVWEYRSIPWLEDLARDLRFALRSLAKSRGFAVAAVLTLALGIGAATAVYSLVDGVLLRPLPLPHPEQLVAVHTQGQEPGGGPWESDTSYPDYLDWRARNHTFAGIAAVDLTSRLIALPNGVEGAVLPMNFVTWNYFDVLGVRPILGRNFAADEDEPGRRVAILGYDYWQRVFARDPKAIGSTIYVSDRAYTVVGVMPKGFVDPSAVYGIPQVWASFAYHPDANPDGKDRKQAIASIVGRLKSGVAAEQAAADLTAIQASLAQSYPEIRYRKGASVRSQVADMTGDVRPALLMLMAAVGAVLLIVCTNVAGLMLSRTMKRRGEMALRTALGASQWRVWRQLLMESLLLGLLGGFAGAALAYLLLHLMLPLVPGDIPRVGEVAINGRVLCFTVAVSLACAVLSSLFPAWKLAAAQPIDAMREQGKGATAGRRAHGFQNGLVVVQTALGFALLLASGLLIRGFVNVRHADTGFNSEHLFTFDVPLTLTRYPYDKKIAFYNALLPKLAALPGVHSVSGGYPLPLWGWYHEVPLEIDGRPAPPDQPLTVRVGQAEPGFFETLGVPLLRGRAFTAADNDAKAPYVAIVNRAFAKRYFPNENPIGRHLRADLSEEANDRSAIDAKVDAQREIVGVVGDTPQDSAIDPPEPLAVFPYAQAPTFMRPRVVMRVAADPMSYEKSAEAAVKSIDPLLFLIDQGSVAAHIDDLSGSQRFETALVSAFAAMALVLTALGLYATLAAMVAGRTREIALRMALGSDRGGVALLVIGRATGLLFTGLALGGAAMLFASRLVASSQWARALLFGVSWFEPKTYAAILLVLAGVALLACLTPTLRAMRVDPMRALRDE